MCTQSHFVISDKLMIEKRVLKLIGDNKFDMIHEFHGSIFLISALAWFIAQAIKVVIGYIHKKYFDLRLLFSSGGMPSSHSSFVCATAASIGFTDGFDSNIFALSVVFSLIVMYDAAGVRRAAGNQAAVINIIIENIEKQGIKIDKQLKELLGHSPIEVISGALLGVFISMIFFFNFFSKVS